MNLFRKIIVTIIFATISLPSAMADVSKLSDIDFAAFNEAISPETLEGKVVYVDFWASWCKPCFKSFPWMSEMQEKYADDGLKIIAINLDKDKSLSTRFLEEAPANFDLVFDGEARLAELFKVKAMPSSYLFDREGNLVTSHLGFQEKKKDLYEDELRQLLGLN